MPENKLPDSERLKLLYDHYKDSLTHAKEFLAKRDRAFYILLVILGLTLIQISSPSEVENIASQILSKYAGITVDVGIELSNVVLWFALLSLLLRYYQAVVYVQRLYPYIHNLEDKISHLYGEENIVRREGKFYHQDYPLFSGWSWRLYTVFFPALVLALTGTKVYLDLKATSGWNLSIILNVTIFMAIVISTILYGLLIHFKK